MTLIDKEESKEKIDLARKVVELLCIKENNIESIKGKGSSQFNEGMKEAIVAESIDNIDSLVDITVFIYASNLDKEDLEGLIEFYQSPIGVKLSHVNGRMNEDIRRNIESWSKTILDKAQERYQKDFLKRKAEEGIKAKDYLPPLQVTRW